MAKLCRIVPKVLVIEEGYFLHINKVLEVINLRKEYQNFTLNDISFSLESKCITGFIGINGSGKTTTIKLILNLIKKDSGCINFLGKNIEIHEKEFKNSIALRNITINISESLRK